MHYSRLIPTILAVLAVQSCHSPSATLSSPPVAPMQKASEGPPVNEAASHWAGSVSGRVTSQGKALAGAEIVLKDALTGDLIGADVADATGSFSVPVAERPSAGLVQVVASTDALVLQALVSVPTSAPGAVASRVLLTTEVGGVSVDWGTSLVTQAIGPKIAEAFLAEGGGGAGVQELLAKGLLLAVTLSQATASYDSLEEARRATFSRTDVREALADLARGANEAVVSAFRQGRGPVFELLPVRLPDAGLNVPPPKISVDRKAGKIKLVVAGVEETLAVSVERFSDSPSSLAVAAALLEAPSVALTLPSQKEREAALGRLKQGLRRSGPSGGSSGDSSPNNHEMWISDVILAETKTSILGPDAPGALSYKPEGSPVNLTLRGRLNANHPPDLAPSDYAYEGFPFQGLLQQTFADNLPHRRVLLDDAVWLPLVPGTPLTDSEMTVSLSPKALTDLAISLPHRITVVDRESTAFANIRVENDQVLPELQPVISGIELIDRMKFKGIKGHDNGNHFGHTKHKYTVQDATASPADEVDEEAEPSFLRIEGYNLPVSHYAHWAQINGARAYAHATWVTDDEQPKTILFLHLPVGFVNKGEGKNSLAYANHFGFRMLSF